MVDNEVYYSLVQPNLAPRIGETFPDPARPTPKFRELKPIVIVRPSKKEMFVFSLDTSIDPPSSKIGLLEFSIPF
jgi:hypothetical protein